MRKLSIGTRIVAVVLLAFFFGMPGSSAQDITRDGLTAAAGDEVLTARLLGINEVPAIYSNGKGDFLARVSNDRTSISYELSYSDLDGVANVAHIHIGQPGVNGNVVIDLCGVGNKPPCPASGTVSGTIVASDVIARPAQGISAGDLNKVLFLIRKGVAYANVHSDRFPGGEIRGQVVSTKGSRGDQ